jgi:hypothetical protein
VTAAAPVRSPRGADPWACIRWVRQYAHPERVVVEGRVVSAMAQKAVLTALADRADPDGTNARPSVATVAYEADMDERTARVALRALELAGLITVRRARPWHEEANRYTVVMRPDLHVVADPPAAGDEPLESPPEAVDDPAADPGHSAPPVGALRPPTCPVPREPPVVPQDRQGPRRRAGCARHPDRAVAGCRDCGPPGQHPPMPPGARGPGRLLSVEELRARAEAGADVARAGLPDGLREQASTRANARKVRCPTCGAPPGQFCRGTRGSRRSLHASRMKAGSEDGGPAVVLEP